MKTRKERDSIGELQIPHDALYGIQSFRAMHNFPISGTQVHFELIRSYLLLKKAAALANRDAKTLDPKRASAISKAVDALLALPEAKLKKHFIVDTYQAGAGTSQNMNANEVIANMANELLGGPRGTYSPVHPNDHVNMSQSTNDTYPTVMRLATIVLSRALTKELTALELAFAKKTKEFQGVLKAARTHLQDAVPITLGQEFAAYRDTLEELRRYLEHSRSSLFLLGIGGSAAGTGINVPKAYTKAILTHLRKLFKEPALKSHPNLCAAMQSQWPMSAYSNALRSLALELTRITNDLRLLSSGPTNGLSEIFLPSTQPGSSIMPGKVNPSILEMGNQVFFKVIGNDTAMAMAVQAGQLELNVMMPLMAHLALESTQILTTTLHQIRTRCIDGILPNRARLQRYAEQTSQIATALNPVLGYTRAGEVAKQAIREGKTVIEIVREQKLLTEAELKRLLDPKNLT